MKDSFFRCCNRMYDKIYRVVLFVTYFILTHKKVKKLDKLSSCEKRNIYNFWKKYNITFGILDDYIWYKDKGRNIDCKLIPETVYHSRIEPYFTNLRMLDGFQDKNYFDTIVDNRNSPKCVFRCINGQFLDKEYNNISCEAILELMQNGSPELICKPTIDSCGGRGIKFIRTLDIAEVDIINLKEEYNGNFIIQEIIQQHEFLNQFNSTSLNTIRICSFLFKGNVHILSSFLRVGQKGSRVDNLSSGGFCIQIKQDGVMSKNAIDYQGEKVHGTRMDEVEIELKMPNWNNVVSVVKKLHFKLAHFQLINWDVALNRDGEPIVVEYNLIDTSVLRHQLNNGPIFGDLTEEVLNEVLLGKTERTSRP